MMTYISMVKMKRPRLVAEGDLGSFGQGKHKPETLLPRNADVLHQLLRLTFKRMMGSC